MSATKFLLDQMLDVDVAKALTDTGYDVVRVADIGMARATDDEILAQSIEDDRVLITLDEHFGDWAILPLEKHSGVIRVKATPSTTANILITLLPFLKKHEASSFCNCLVIVSEHRIRRIKTG
jgi:predicted nuclease of predicted toxin-antitoxin system